MWPGTGRPQLRTPGSVLPGQAGKRKARERRLVALGTPGFRCPLSPCLLRFGFVSAGSGP